jgi:hypothetical protein
MLPKFQKLSGDDPYQPSGSLVGIFVKSLENDNNHVGFLFFYQNKDLQGNIIEQGTKRLDFMTNELIMFRSIDAKDKREMLHAPMSLNHIDSTILASYLTAVIKANGTKPPILYGMDWDGKRNCFDSHGKYTEREDIWGLSCATFLDALIAKGLRKPAVAHGTWEPTEHDSAWRVRKVEAYRKRLSEGRTAVTEDQIAAMEAIEPFTRLRPEQIAGAAVAPKEDWAICFKCAQSLAESVIRDFQSALASPSTRTPSQG